MKEQSVEAQEATVKSLIVYGGTLQHPACRASGTT